MEKEFKYKKIIILGGIASGKSTLADRIGRYTGYSVFHLDILTFDKNRQRKSIEDCNIIFSQFLSKDVGVVDGTFVGLLSSRIDWSDIIIFINIPNYLQLYNFLGRNIKYFLKIDKGHGRPKNTKQNFIKELILCMGWNKKNRQKIFAILESVKDKKVVITKEPRKLDLEELLK